MRLYQHLVERKWLKIINIFSCTSFSVISIGDLIIVDRQYIQEECSYRRPFVIDKRHIQRYNNLRYVNVMVGDDYASVCVITLNNDKADIIDILTSNVGDITRSTTLVWDGESSKLSKN